MADDAGFGSFAAAPPPTGGGDVDVFGAFAAAPEAGAITDEFASSSASNDRGAGGSDATLHTAVEGDTFAAFSVVSPADGSGGVGSGSSDIFGAFTSDTAAAAAATVPPLHAAAAAPAEGLPTSAAASATASVDGDLFGSNLSGSAGAAPVVPSLATGGVDLFGSVTRSTSDAAPVSPVRDAVATSLSDDVPSLPPPTTFATLDGGLSGSLSTESSSDPALAPTQETTACLDLFGSVSSSSENDIEIRHKHSRPISSTRTPSPDPIPSSIANPMLTGPFSTAEVPAPSVLNISGGSDSGGTGDGDFETIIPAPIPSPVQAAPAGESWGDFGTTMPAPTPAPAAAAAGESWGDFGTAAATGGGGSDGDIGCFEPPIPAAAAIPTATAPVSIPKATVEESWIGETVGAVLTGTPLEIRHKIQTIIEGAQIADLSSGASPGSALASLSEGSSAPLWQKCSSEAALEAKAVAWRYSASERVLAAHTGVDLNLITAAKDRVDERPAFAAALDGDACMAVLMPTSGGGSGSIVSAPALLMPTSAAPTLAPTLAPASLDVLGGGLAGLSSPLDSAVGTAQFDLDLSALGSLGNSSFGTGDVSRSTSVGSSEDVLNLFAASPSRPSASEEVGSAEGAGELNLTALFQQGSPSRRNADGVRAMSAQAQPITDGLPDYSFMLQTVLA